MQTKTNNIAILNRSEVDDNLSPEYHVNKKLGRDPYFISDYKVEPCSPSSHKLKLATYLNKEDAKSLSTLGKGIRDLMGRFNEIKNK